MTAINDRQLVALQTLYSQYARKSLDVVGDQRKARLWWASQNCGRKIDSFKSLTTPEVDSLIRLLKTSLGQPLDRPARQRRPRHRRRDRAQAAGTEGRRGLKSATTTLVSAEDLARIDDAISRLGWTRERFDAFLKSSSSPLHGRANPEIRTLGDANAVWWGMKALLKHDGKWRPDDENRFQTAEAH